jgi:YfiH family protein
MGQALEVVAATWPAPPNVRALTTTRTGGASRGPYDSLNLGDHVGDTDQAVVRNRELLHETLKLPGEPLWLKQVHGTNVVDAAGAHIGAMADGAHTDRAATVLAVLTADCLPVFLCDRAGSEIALLHAGWRGLAAGVIEAGVHAMQARATDLMAWFGPAIGPQAYTVGDDVRAAFVSADARAARAFRATGPSQWLADLYALARQRLNALGVRAVYGGQSCTWQESDRFFSYRRDGQCGRMASLLWLEAGSPRA